MRFALLLIVAGIGIAAAGSPSAADPVPARIVDVKPEFTIIHPATAKSLRQHKGAREPIPGPLVELRAVAGPDGSIELRCTEDHDHSVHARTEPIR
ncbi:MAG TPA: hypothetical protein VFG21_08830 [Xanthomonadaceae bacterium]|nr:hypothetical protein [Xanthomonadaceae bacterium]